MTESDERARVMRDVRDLVWFSDQRRQLAAAEIGLSLTEVTALSHVHEVGEIGPGELAAKLGLSNSSVTALVDRLEARGLIERSPHGSDRRRLVLVPTPAGAEVVDHQLEQLSVLVGLVPVSEAAGIARALRVLAATIHTATAADPTLLKVDPVG